MPKIPKKAQVAFNQFVFDTMMQKMREVELLEKRIAKLEGSTHVRDEATSGSFRSLFARVSNLENTREVQMRVSIAQATAITTLQTQASNSANRITALTNEVLKLRDEKKKPCRPRSKRIPL